MNELALFAGAGGGILGGHLLGWRTVCAVEYDAYAASVLVSRQNDGCLAPFPVWDDVRTFDGRPWRGIVDVVSGGFPCQDISAAGRGAGIDGERSGLWGEMARIIGEVRPKFAFVENSPMLTSRGLSRVCGDLAELGYDCRWGVVSAADAGACHLRKRCWIVAYTKGTRLAERRDISEGSERPHRNKAQSRRDRPARRSGDAIVEAGIQWTTETVLLRTSYVVANRVDAIKAIGNGQVPAVAALAWRLLTEEQT
jgi:DNA (cytosine-5)-methyltransferase 1